MRVNGREGMRGSNGGSRGGSSSERSEDVLMKEYSAARGDVGENFGVRFGCVFESTKDCCTHREQAHLRLHIIDTDAFKIIATTKNEQTLSIL